MSSTEFMIKLKHLLRRMPEDEKAEALEYYEQYFADGGEVKDSPEEVARNILADFADDEKKTSTKKHLISVSRTWIVILGVIGIPILLPVGVCILALFICCFAVYIGVFAAWVAFIGTAVGCFIGAFAIIAISWPTAVLFIGVSFVLAAAGMLLFKPIIDLFKVMLKGMSILGSKALRRRS